jgi:hypothetical protein
VLKRQGSNLPVRWFLCTRYRKSSKQKKACDEGFSGRGVSLTIAECAPKACLERRGGVEGDVGGGGHVKHLHGANWMGVECGGSSFA